MVINKDGNTIYCEKSKNAYMAQPINSLSGLAYIIVAYLIYKYEISNKDETNKKYNENNSRYQEQLSQFKFYFAIILFVLGITTFAMHSSYNKVWTNYDGITMFIIITLLLLFNVIIIIYKKNMLQFKIIFTIISILLILISKTKYNNLNNFMGLIFLTIISFIYVVKYKDGDTYYLWKSVFYFIIALIVWKLSQSRQILCNPKSIFQGHALWHILTAIAFYQLFLFYTSLN